MAIVAINHMVAWREREDAVAVIMEKSIGLLATEFNLFVLLVLFSSQVLANWRWGPGLICVNFRCCFIL